MISRRIMKNTAALFGRQVLVLVVGLYTTSALLRALGIGDFALLTVLINLVGLVLFLPAALDMIIRRYLAVELGKGDLLSLGRAHDASLALTLAVAVLALVLLETVGIGFVMHYLAVDPDRLGAARILFHLIALSVVLNMVAGFYNAVIAAHEDMHVSALISIGEVLLRLAAVASLGWLTGDLVVIFGALTLAISILRLAACRWVCVRGYAECRHWLPRRPDLATLCGMLGFSGWTILGQVTTVCRNQAVTILLNQTFSPATVAARALASTVSAQMLTFATNFSAALDPPIIKAHASDERDQMFALILTGARITFFLGWLVTLPIIALAPGVLDLWLGPDHPEQTVLFVRLALIENAITAISIPLMTAVRATGKVRFYEISLGFLQLMVLVLSWLLVRMGQPAESVYLVAIGINLAMLAMRMGIVSRLTGLPARSFLRRSLAPALMVVAVSSGLILVLFELVPGAQTLTREPGALAAAAAICLVPGAVIYSLGLGREERHRLNAMIRRRLARRGSAA